MILRTFHFSHDFVSFSFFAIPGTLHQRIAIRSIGIANLACAYSRIDVFVTPSAVIGIFVDASGTVHPRSQVFIVVGHIIVIGDSHQIHTSDSAALAHTVIRILLLCQSEHHLLASPFFRVSICIVSIIGFSS
jgi:hypothetical protein